MDYQDAVLQRVTRETDSIYSFALSVPDGMTWKAGQFASSQLRGVPLDEGDTDSRIFTIASSPEEEILLFATRIGDRHSSYKDALLHRIQPGDVIGVSSAMGGFAIPEKADRALLIAGGIGVTPMRAVLKAECLSDRPGRELTLIYSDSREEYAFPDFWKEAAEELPDLQVCYVNNRYDLAAMVRSYAGTNGADASYLISGAPAMNDSMAALLLEQGIPESQLIRDSFMGY